MTLKRIKGHIVALFAIATALMTCMTATPAFAQNVAPTENLTTTFNKYLLMESQANVPNVTFGFEITPGNQVEASGGNPAIYAGIGNPTVGSATFAPGDSTNQGTPTESDATGYKYATKEVTVDFSGVSFSAPGIYRYIITESASSADGIINDGTTTRTLDVYVTYDDDSNGRLVVMGYVIYLGTMTGNADLKSNKSAGYTNSYTTYDLTLKKQVTGNQGDRDKYFAFTVTISGAVTGTKYSVDLRSAEQSPTVDGQGQANSITLTANDSGTVTATYYLKNDQSITIQGLTTGTSYQIAETSYANDGYTTSYVIDTGSSVTSTDTNKQAMNGTDHTVVFTNDKEGTVPTGILLETGPYVLMGVVVIAGLIALVATSRRRTRE